jgi:NosR/NirI family transcriptional regulator, nitrous oxide reductase regulator
MTQPSADPWGFEDEAAETWAEILAPQAMDLAVLSAFLILAFIGFRRKSVPLKYVTLVAALGYMGFAKSHLISITNIFSLLDGNLPVVKHNLAFYLLAGFTVVTTVLWGRLYCGRVCAFGALTQLMDAVLPDRCRITLPWSIERRAAWIKFALLGAVIIYFVTTSDTTIYRYVEPFWMFGLFETAPMWIALGLLLAATVFVRNLYCRFLCPVGATLGLLSYLTVFRIKRWSECSTCKICEKACEWGAIDGPRILVSECVRCDDCERLYADHRRCPHCRLIAYKARKVIPLTVVDRRAAGS